jgi:N-acetylmuramoyl-L-alanine amidase
VLAEVAAAAALVCLDPGHGTAPGIGRQVEPIGPGSAQLKVKDPGGAAGEAPVALAIARRTRALLLARGYRVAMTRSAAGYRGGNRERARFCNARGASLMIRIHADGSTDPAVLVETGFMTNRREAGLLRSSAYQQRLAHALAGGAQRFLSR